MRRDGVASHAVNAAELNGADRAVIIRAAPSALLPGFAWLTDLDGERLRPVVTVPPQPRTAKAPLLPRLLARAGSAA